MHIYTSKHGMERARARVGLKTRAAVARWLAGRLKEALRAGIRPDKGLRITLRVGPDIDAILAPHKDGWILITVIDRVGEGVAGREA